MQRKNNMHIHFFQDVVTIFSCNIFKLPKTWLTPRLYHHDVILLKVSETHSHQQKFPFVDRSYSLLYLLYPPDPNTQKKSPFIDLVGVYKHIQSLSSEKLQCFKEHNSTKFWFLSFRICVHVFCDFRHLLGTFIISKLLLLFSFNVWDLLIT